MGTQGAGRKRSTNKDRTTAEDDALNLIAREAEARLAAKRAARAEAREIRMKELERQQKELSDEDERMSVGSRGSVRVEDGNYLEKGSRAASALTATTLTSLGGTSSRRGSGETALTLDAETSIKEIKEIHELKDQIQDVESKYNQNLKEAKDKLTETEEKYRKAMVSNAQLDNEKNNLMYQVDTLKDSLMELEELLSESRREYEDKFKDYEREKHAHTVLQFQFSELKETLKQSEDLLNDIRQLRLKEEGFHREISDLQETVEWKDKKISALERQKEYTDAIRIERDELREEAVKLKDILKKHGIVLGPDLNINGEVTETVNNEESSSGDTAPHTNQESPMSPISPMSPTDGNNSMLGNTEEEAKDTTKEETEPVQSQEIHNQNEGSQFCNGPDISNDEQAKPKSEDVGEISDAVELEPHKLETSTEKNIVVDEPTEHKDKGDQESGDPEDIKNDAIQPTQDQVNKADETDTAQMIKNEKQMESAVNDDVSTKDAVKPVDINNEPIAVAPKLQQDLEKPDDSANVDSEDVSAKAQSTSAGGKKKKRKKRGKKKGHSDEKNENNIEPEKEQNTKLETVKSENGQSNTVHSPNSQSQNITDDGQINKERNNIEAANDDTKQTGKHAQPVSGVAKDAKMKSLTETVDQLEPMEKVTIVDTNTCLEKVVESVTSVDVVDATLGTTNSEESESMSLESTPFLETGATNIQTEDGSKLHTRNDTDVAKVDKSKSNENSAGPIIIFKQTFTSIPSEQSCTSNGQCQKEVKSNVEDNVSCENACQSLPSVEQDDILNKKESPKLETVGLNEESNVKVALTTEATDKAILANVASKDITVFGEDKNAENIVAEDGKEPEKGFNDLQSDAGGVVEVHAKTLEDTVEVCVDVLATETSNTTTKNEIDQNVESDKLDTSSKESQSAEGVTVDLSECSIEDTEMEIALSSGEFKTLEEQVEVGVDILVEDNTKDPTTESEAKNVENVSKEVDLVDIESEITVQSESESGACQTELTETSTELEVKQFEDKVEKASEVLVEDGYSENQLINIEQMLTDNAENCKIELDIVDKEKESVVPVESESSMACHIAEVPEHSIEVEAKAMNQDSEEEDDGEGLSFDFDDAEVDAVVEQSGETKLSEEEFEVAVEVLADDLKVESNNTEPLVPSQNLENVSKGLDILDNEAESAAQINDSSLASQSCVNKVEDQTSQDLLGATKEQGPIIVVDAIQNSSENNNKSSCPVEEDAVSLQSNDSVKSRQEGSTSCEPPRSGKDTKKTSKKGKGKGKDECKMT